MDSQLYNYRALVTGVYDGDSITADIDLGFNIWMRGEERAAGLVSRDRLRDLILDKEILITSYKDKSGKYGRWLATLFLNDGSGFENVNLTLLAEGLAEVYK